MTYRRLGLSVTVIAAVVAAFSVAPVSAGSSSIQTISDSQLKAMTSTAGGVAGAPSLNTGNTVAH